MKKKTYLATAFLLAYGTALAVDTPNMKEGLWKIHTVTTRPGAPPNETTSSLCRNHAYDEQVTQMAENHPGCTVTHETTGDKRTFTSSCKVGPTTIQSSGTTTVSGDTSFRTEYSTTYSPPFMGKSQESSVQEQTYAGPCPAGMNPGDRMLADGTIQHLGPR